MKRWFWISLVLIFSLEILAGCGGGGEKYIGTWVSEKENFFTPHGKTHIILEIKKDGTWQWKLPPTYHIYPSGEWKVENGRIRLYGGKTDRGPFLYPSLAYEMEIQKNRLIEIGSFSAGTTFVKRD